MRLSLRPVVINVVFAAILLFAQQVGMAHLIAHGSGHGHAHSHSKGVPTQACDQCLAFAQVEPAPPAVVHALVVQERVVSTTSGSCRSIASRPPNAFRSRAPPVFH